MASLRHTMHIYTTLRLGVVHSVYVAIPDFVNTTRCRRFCIERTVHVAEFTGGHVTPPCRA